MGAIVKCLRTLDRALLRPSKVKSYKKAMLRLMKQDSKAFTYKLGDLRLAQQRLTEVYEALARHARKKALARKPRRPPGAPDEKPGSARASDECKDQLE